MTPQAKGTICGIIAAVSYGTNPLGALYLYRVGLNTDSVLFYRYTLAALLLMLLMKVQKISFAVSWRELSIIGGLGILFAASSITLFSSFHYMDAGVASTLLFVYPIMVALIMALFFHEKITLSTTLSIILALSGIAMLYQGDGNEVLSTVGIVLVMASSLSYALYIIVVNRSGLRMSSIKLTFYVLLFCILTIVLHSLTGESHHLQPLTTSYMWFFAALLAILPTVVSLVTMSVAVRIIGSTPTAILGALEPLTAVAIGVTLFDEPFTARLAWGILLILSGVILIIMGKSLGVRQLRLLIGRIRQFLTSAFGPKYPRHHPTARRRTATDIHVKK